MKEREGEGHTHTHIYYTSAFLLPRLVTDGNSFIASGRVQWTGSLITASSDGNKAPTILPLVIFSSAEIIERLFSEEEGGFTSSVLSSVEVAESSLLDCEEEGKMEEETEERTSKNWRREGERRRNKKKIFKMYMYIIVQLNTSCVYVYIKLFYLFTSFKYFKFFTY